MGKNSKKKRRSRKRYVKAVEEAYSWLVALRKHYEENDKDDLAEKVEQVYKDLWCECLPDPAPWA